MTDLDPLDRLTPRERDVYEVWRAHPDWSNAQIGRAVYMPAPHVIRRYKQNIREKVGAMVEDPLERLSPKMLAVHELDLQGLTPAEIGRRMRLSEFAVRTFLEDIEERLNPSPETEG
jgi:DNA-binding CsgD family transcriptional regulator